MPASRGPMIVRRRQSAMSSARAEPASRPGRARTRVRAGRNRSWSRAGGDPRTPPNAGSAGARAAEASRAARRRRRPAIGRRPRCRRRNGHALGLPANGRVRSRRCRRTQPISSRRRKRHRRRGQPEPGGPRRSAPERGSRLAAVAERGGYASQAASVARQWRRIHMTVLASFIPAIDTIRRRRDGSSGHGQPRCGAHHPPALRRQAARQRPNFPRPGRVPIGCCGRTRAKPGPVPLPEQGRHRRFYRSAAARPRRYRYRRVSCRVRCRVEAGYAGEPLGAARSHRPAVAGRSPHPHRTRTPRSAVAAERA